MEWRLVADWAESMDTMKGGCSVGAMVALLAYEMVCNSVADSAAVMAASLVCLQATRMADMSV